MTTNASKRLHAGLDKLIWLRIYSESQFEKRRRQARMFDIFDVSICDVLVCRE